jgi:aminoglycoside 6'-N-acetyltransferase I
MMTDKTQKRPTALESTDDQYPDGMSGFTIRPARVEDLPAIAEMCHLLWPDDRAEDHARWMRPALEGKPVGGMPDTVFVAEVEGVLIGFLEATLRSHADGCDPGHPVGYLEGWYVAPEHRRRGVGAKLVAAAEEWARAQGCSEMASDTWIDSTGSQRAHEALGYEVVDRCVHYRKPLL